MNYNDYAKQWAGKQKSGKHPAHEYIEKPAMQKLVQKYGKNSQNILLIGCGDSSEAHLFEGLDPANLVGFDSAAGLIEIATFEFEAKSNYHFETLKCEDLGAYDFGMQFDLVYSSLTLHYLPDWPRFFTDLKKHLKPGATFIFSVQHPIKWGSETIRRKDYNQFLLGYKKNKQTGEFQIWGDYLSFRSIKDRLFGQLEIEYYHRSLETMFGEITGSGFQITELLEPQPIAESKKLLPDFWAVHSRIPLFLIFGMRLI